jgi:outer membrane lipoprotein carrier protein
MRLQLLTSALFALLLTANGAMSAAQPPAEGVARQVQDRYQTIKDFTADFTHTYEGGVLRRKTTERGSVLIKKPGRMRWSYTQPEQKVFVSDGLKIYMHVPADRQVTVSSMPGDDKASTPILFLVGKGDLVRDFTVSYAEPITGVTFPADAHALKLTPRTKVPEYEWLVLVVDKSFKLQMLVARDSQSGTSVFTFTNLKENVGLKDSQFNFTIPRGADVITQS